MSCFDLLIDLIISVQTGTLFSYNKLFLGLLLIAFVTVNFSSRSGSEWLRVTPWGMRKGLNWIRTHYNNIPVYITENGVSDKSGSLNDTWRIDFYKAYINEVLKGRYLLTKV